MEVDESAFGTFQDIRPTKSHFQMIHLATSGLSGAISRAVSLGVMSAVFRLSRFRNLDSSLSQRFSTELKSVVTP
jgi:hypothetical protein